jgi:hypothetical protein
VLLGCCQTSGFFSLVLLVKSCPIFVAGQGEFFKPLQIQVTLSGLPWPISSLRHQLPWLSNPAFHR